ncbi:EAL domain-containing protein, partial [Agrobacterium sp. S2]|nr:EAL domain-containing protein [Agrobacterium sp. S2]
GRLASVGYLRRFGFDRMKIDRCAHQVGARKGGRSLEMHAGDRGAGESLDIPVTAEGVETEEQAAILAPRDAASPLCCA